jgi:CheY-like chemotaxis protein
METKIAILIVDDEPTNRVLLKKLLKNSKHTLLEAENGQEALAVFKKAIEDGYQVRAIIMDFNMPVLDGDQSMTQICRYHEFLTGKTMRNQDFTTAIMFTADKDYKRATCKECLGCPVIVKYKPDDLLSLKALVE